MQRYTRKGATKDGTTFANLGCVSLDRYGEVERRVPVRQDLCARAGPESFLALPRAFVLGYCRSPLPGLSLAPVTNGSGNSGLLIPSVAGEGARATRATVNIRGQECPRYTGFSCVADT